MNKMNFNKNNLITNRKMFRVSIILFAALLFFTIPSISLADDAISNAIKYAAAESGISYTNESLVFYETGSDMFWAFCGMAFGNQEEDMKVMEVYHLSGILDDNSVAIGLYRFDSSEDAVAAIAIGKKQTKFINIKGSTNSDYTTMSEDEKAMAKGMDDLMDSYVHKITNQTFSGNPAYYGHGYFSMNFSNDLVGQYLESLYGDINNHAFYYVKDDYLIGITYTSDSNNQGPVMSIAKNISSKLSGMKS